MLCSPVFAGAKHKAHDTRAASQLRGLAQSNYDNSFTQRPEPRKRRKITFIKAKATGKAKGHKPSTSPQTRPRLLAYLVHRHQMARWLRHRLFNRSPT